MKVEILFAHLKRHMGFERLMLRGFSSTNDEFLRFVTDLQQRTSLDANAVLEAEVATEATL